MAEPRTVSLGIRGLAEAVEIGRGGFAVVYRAYQPAFDRFVAVKIFGEMAFDGTPPAVFERECRAIGRISGRANILTVYDAGTTESGRPYIVMAYQANGSLEDLLRQQGAIPWREALVIGAKLAKALQVAHDAGVLHRDVKPDNILISDDGEPMLADFGIARLNDVTQMTKSMPSFTPAHVAPEVLAGEDPTWAVDIYSLASTIFTLIVGRPPFIERDGENVYVIIRRVEREPVPDLLRPLHVPDRARRLIETSLSKKPEDRPPSAAAFAHELEEARRESQEDAAIEAASLRSTDLLEPSDAVRTESVDAERRTAALAPLGPLPDSAERAEGRSWQALVDADLDYYTQNGISTHPFRPDVEPRTIELTAEAILIGRPSSRHDAEPHIDLSKPFEDPGVSRTHAVLTRQEDGSYALMDPGSTNGTFLNNLDHPVTQRVLIALTLGDCIYLGLWTRIQILSTESVSVA